MRQEEKKLDDKVIFNRVKSARMMKDLCNFVGLSLIKEVECEFCKHKNKAKDDWVLRFGKDICEECGEELPLEKIYGNPIKEYINFVLKDDEVKKPEKKKVVAKYTPIDFNIKTQDTLENPIEYIDPSIPDPIAKGLQEYIKELAKKQKEYTKKSIAEEAEKDEFHRKWGYYKPYKPEGNDENSP